MNEFERIANICRPDPLMMLRTDTERILIKNGNYIEEVETMLNRHFDELAGIYSMPHQIAYNIQGLINLKNKNH